MYRRLLSLAFVVLACSACTFLTGVPVEAKPCAPVYYYTDSVPLVDSTGVVSDTAIVSVGYCR